MRDTELRSARGLLPDSANGSIENEFEYVWP